MRPANEPVDVILEALVKRHVELQYRGIIRAAVIRAGVGAPGRKGDPDRAYIAGLMAYYLGKGTVPIPPRSLSTAALDRWAKRRAWDELEKDAGRLPALRLEREPIDDVDDLERRRRQAVAGVSAPRPPTPLPPAA